MYQTTVFMVGIKIQKMCQGCSWADLNFHPIFALKGLCTLR